MTARRISREMNLAVRDIRHNFGRFALTTVGIGLLLMIVMGMGGIYRGLIYEATLLVDQVGATCGWCKAARADHSPKFRAFRPTWKTGCAPCRAWPRRTGSFRTRSSASIEAGRCAWWCKGLSWPEDKGEWLPLIAGRALRQAHYEMIADRSLGLPLGEKLKLGKDVYEVVGLTRGMVGTAGDGLAFFTVSDAQAIQFDLPGEATRLERRARLARLESLDLGRVQPRCRNGSSARPASCPRWRRRRSAPCW